MFKQLVEVEFHNAGSQLYEFESSEEIDMEKVIEYFEDNFDFDEERDSLTFLDEATKIKLS